MKLEMSELDINETSGLEFVTLAGMSWNPWQACGECPGDLL